MIHQFFIFVKDLGFINCFSANVSLKYVYFSTSQYERDCQSFVKNNFKIANISSKISKL